jgi:hypothetical protein
MIRSRRLAARALDLFCPVLDICSAGSKLEKPIDTVAALRVNVDRRFQAPGVQIVLYLFGVAVFANYAWHIFNANEEDWREAKTDAKQEGEHDGFSCNSYFGPEVMSVPTPSADDGPWVISHTLNDDESSRDNHRIVVTAWAL